ncbi:MAG: glycosyltransferase family 39 protein [Planctomycetes bacterium]|nr:glycosyltransferase family 39 protein [Planctomycetota bacterium]
MIDAQTTAQIPSPSALNRLEPVARTVAVVDAPPEPPRTAPRAAIGVLVALALLGCGLRLVALFTDRCLWLDEAMLALNLVNRTPRQLLDPLDWNQGAPVGFLLAVKGTITALGASEWALRLVPFLASCAGVFGFAFLSRRLLPGHAATLATALMALSPYLISYAAECKQYACDAAMTVGLLSVAMGLLEGRGGAARWGGLAVVGALAVWCSHPATFVLAGIGTALLLHALVERDRKRFIAGGLTVACWLVSFGACYVLCLKQLGGNKYLTDYWTEHFMPLPPKGVGDLAWVADHLIAFFAMPGGFGGEPVPLGGFAAFLALIGLRECARERWPVAVALAAPVGFLLFASGLHKYPFGGRLLLFLIPLGLLLVARGAWAVFDAVRDRNRFAALALIVLLVGAAAWQTSGTLRRPLRHEQIRPVIAQVRAEMRPGDRVYVYYSAIPAFQFYTRDNPFPEERVTLGNEYPNNPGGYRDELNRLHGRVWVIYSHPHHGEEIMIRSMFESRVPREQMIKERGATAWLYELK